MAHLSADVGHIVENPFAAAAAPRFRLAIDVNAPVLADAPQEQGQVEHNPGLANVAVNAVPTTPGGTGLRLNQQTFRAAEALGAGNFGQVRRFPSPNGESVAVKTGQNILHEARYTQQAQGAAGHPNIVRSHGMAQTAAGPALVTEALGEDMDHVQEALNRRLNARDISEHEYWETIKYLTRQTLSGVEHIGQQNLVHRDLKGANVLLDEATLRPKIIDFGIARENDNLPHDALGTAGYRAPEQQAGRPVPQSDVYSVGAMAYRAAPRAANQAAPQMTDAVQGIVAQLADDGDGYRNFLRQTMAGDVAHRLDVQGARQHRFLQAAAMTDDDARNVLAHRHLDTRDRVLQAWGASPQRAEAAAPVAQNLPNPQNPDVQAILQCFGGYMP